MAENPGMSRSVSIRAAAARWAAALGCLATALAASGSHAQGAEAAALQASPAAPSAAAGTAEAPAPSAAAAAPSAPSATEAGAAPASPTAADGAAAPPRLPRPISLEALAELRTRPVGGPVTAPRTRGDLDLRNRRLTIAEYRVLVEQSGELVVPVQDGQVLGQPVRGEQVLLAYQSQQDHTLIQSLVDQAWQDLQARLASANVAMLPADKVVAEYGAIHAATEPGSTPDKPVLAELDNAKGVRRYLTYAPTGMRLVKPSPGGLGVGDLVARVTYRTERIEALSLTIAINLNQLDTGGARRSSSFAPPADGTALSPMMELGPAPSASLVYAHNQTAHANLTEAMALGPEFARLRLAQLGEAPARSTLDKLMDASRELATSRRRLNAVLETDGAATARLMVFALSAANQAIVDAIAAAR